jgi:CP family cyanate transporter-like MFS transporter
MATQHPVKHARESAARPVGQSEEPVDSTIDSKVDNAIDNSAIDNGAADNGAADNGAADSGVVDGGTAGTVFRDRRSALAPTTLLIVAILLVAANLRPAVTSLGPVIDEVRGSLHTSATWISVLTALPGLCFGLAGFIAPLLARRLGLARAIGLALVLLTLGIAARVLAGPAVVVGGTLIACAGIAVCNVLIPVVVKESYPHRIGLLTGLYTAVLQGAAALGSVVTPPVDSAFGGWRPALGEWAVLAAVAAVVWTVAARHAHGTSRTVAGAGPGPARSLVRNRLAWVVTGFFGLQAMFAYAVMGWAPQILMDIAGVSRGEAGAMMAVMSVIGVPLSLVVAPIAARRHSQSGWLAGLTAVGAVGLVGLLVAPAAAPWLWSVFLGVGMGVFAVAVAVISLRTASASDTRQLSAMAQSVGYLLAAVGPLLVGVLHGTTGGWTTSLVVMLVGVLVQIVVGVAAGRPKVV